MVLIPAGTFTMGAADLQSSQPVREVFVSDFCLDTHLVTNAQLDRYVDEYRETPDAVLLTHPTGDVSLIARGKEMPNSEIDPSPGFRKNGPALVSEIVKKYGKNPCLFAPEVAAFRVFSDLCQENGYDPFSALISVLRERGDPFEVRRVVPEERELRRGFDHPKKPAVKVNWYEAFGYAAAQRVGETYCKRLPREAEWEKAGRGGKGYEYGTATGEIGPDLAHYERRSTAKVGSYPPNPYGLYDMSGNAWEWCMDWYAGRYDPNQTQDSRGPVTGNWRVLRGGAWYGDRHVARVALRFVVHPGLRVVGNGFRCAFGAPGLY
jgi:formylglycine-generating enzyme required for sulfatase activity